MLEFLPCRLSFVSDVYDIYLVRVKEARYRCLWKGHHTKYIMEDRKLCPICTQRPLAVNYKREDRTYYRAVCSYCSRAGKKAKHLPPLWYKSGYRKKPQCERCGFKAELPEQQLMVYHVDGDLRNNDRVNLKTVCLNCRPMVSKSRLPWKPADLVPDF